LESWNQTRIFFCFIFVFAFVVVLALALVFGFWFLVFGFKINKRRKAKVENQRYGTKQAAPMFAGYEFSNLDSRIEDPYTFCTTKQVQWKK